MIFDSWTFAWHTGQLTITAKEEEDEDEEEATLCSPAEDCREAEEGVVVALVVLCSTAGDFAFIDSFDAAESLPKVFWKKSKMLAELLRSSHALFLGVRFLPTAADVLSLSELVKSLDCTALEVLPWDPVVTTDETLEWFVMLGLGLGVLGEEVK